MCKHEVFTFETLGMWTGCPPSLLLWSLPKNPSHGIHWNWLAGDFPTKFRERLRPNGESKLGIFNPHHVHQCRVYPDSSSRRTSHAPSIWHVRTFPVFLKRSGYVCVVLVNIYWSVQTFEKSFFWTRSTELCFWNSIKKVCCRIVYVIHTFLARREWERKDNGQNFSRRDCIRKFSYHEIFCSFVSEEIPQ